MASWAGSSDTNDTEGTIFFWENAKMRSFLGYCE